MIVIEPEAAGEVLEAALILSDYVEKITGTSLRISNDRNAAPRTAIYIGQTDSGDLDALPPLSTETGREGFVVRLRDGNLFLSGQTPEASAYAVYDFMETNLGIRWFAPGPLWEHVPDSPGQLEVAVEDRTVLPDYTYRLWSGHGMHRNWHPDSWREWDLKNRASSRTKAIRRDKSTRMHRAFPPDKFAATNPQYYPLVDGERYIPSEWPPASKHDMFMPNTGNPEVVEVMAEYIRDWFEQRPERESFSMVLDDVTRYDESEASRALDPPGAFEKREFSDRYYRFVNDVARKIKETHPHKYIGAMAYRQFRQPPRSIPELEDNVYLLITQNAATWWDEEAEKRDKRLTEKWASMVEQPLIRYEYYGLGFITPRFYPGLLDEHIKYDHSRGFRGQYTEIKSFLPHQAPMVWAFAKLQWDTSRSMEDLLNEFYEKMFGHAAGPMARYYKLLEASWMNSRAGRTSGMLDAVRNFDQQRYAISLEQIAKGLRILDEARDSAESSKVRERIAIIRDALLYSRHALLSYERNEAIRRQEVATSRQAEEMKSMLAEYAAIVDERNLFWRQAAKTDTILGEAIRGLQKGSLIQSPRFGELDRSIIGGILTLFGWYQSNRPEELEAVYKFLMDQSFDESIANVIELAYTTLDSENLVRNPGFDDRSTGDGRGSGLKDDWIAQNAPAEWSFWQRKKPSPNDLSDYYVESGDGYEGANRAVIDGGQGGTYLQSFPVEPGDRFLATVWMKGEASEDARRGGFTEADAASLAKLGIRFRNANGLIPPPDRRLHIDPPAKGAPVEGWQRLAIAVEAPEDAVGLTLMPGAGDLREGMSVSFAKPRLFKR